MDDLLSDLTPQRRYRTPAEIRAIPNHQWETFTAFTASFECQKTLRTVLQATVRRIEAARR